MDIQKVSGCYQSNNFDLKMLQKCEVFVVALQY